MHKTKFVCPICGYPELDEPPYDEYGYALFDICPCCGIEFGYEDSLRTHEELRKIWIDNGMTWWNTNRKPPTNWNPKEQLQILVDRIDEINNKPDKIARGAFMGQGGERSDVIFKIKGDDVVATETDGTIITFLEDGVKNNSFVINALKSVK